MSKLTERIADHYAPIRFTRLERTELEKGEFCPPDEQEIAPYPLGFFKALTSSGLDGDLGFYCDKCKALVRLGLEPGQRIWHCGRNETVPQPSARMETRQVGTFKGQPTMPEGMARIIPVGM